MTFKKHHGNKDKLMQGNALFTFQFGLHLKIHSVFQTASSSPTFFYKLKQVKWSKY